MWQTFGVYSRLSFNWSVLTFIMADTNAKVANSYEDQEEGYRNDDMAGGDTEDGKNSQTDQKDGRRGGRRFNYRRRRRRTSSDEPTGPVEPIVLGVGEL